MEKMNDTELEDPNARINRILVEGRVPLLETDVIQIETTLRELHGQQRMLAKLLAEAMNDSAETWHDNAPAEAITSQADLVSKRAHTLIAVLNDGEVLDLPGENYNQVTLGSRVYVRYGQSSEIESMLISGYSRDVLDLDADGSSMITIKSPLGKALLGAKVDDEVAFNVGARSITVNVVAIEQPTLAE
jgi:transcription elongation GreA/GreB family factor